jgi:hypothetical protein
MRQGKGSHEGSHKSVSRHEILATRDVEGEQVPDDRLWTCLKCGRIGSTVRDHDGPTLVLHVIGLDPHNCDFCASMLDGFNMLTLTPGEWI